MPVFEAPAIKEVKEDEEKRRGGSEARSGRRAALLKLREILSLEYPPFVSREKLCACLHLSISPSSHLSDPPS
jgi:hypothetical protein